jgi:hypothetical protein
MDKMYAYVVVFYPDPNSVSPNVRHQGFLTARDSFKGFWLSESTRLLVCSDSVKDLWRKLFLENARDFSPKDRLYIISMCKPFEGYGIDNLRLWLEDNLPDGDQSQENSWGLSD